jgi:hypothetical protein
MAFQKQKNILSDEYEARKCGFTNGNGASEMASFLIGK